MDSVRTLTIVKTDLQGFTTRVENLSSAELDAFLKSNRELTTRVLRRFGGTVFKEEGDAVLAAFDSSTRALLSCVELQRELAQQPQQHDSMGLRIMLACGDVLLQNNDIFGSPVNAVSRMEPLTPAGQIYFSESVYQSCNRHEIASEPVGVFTLEGFRDPVRLHRTTFRHQTRELPRTAVLFTDLTGFTRFALGADLRLVEDVMQQWTQDHVEAAAQHHGLLRTIMGDGHVLTFDSGADAVHAWLMLCQRADVDLANVSGSFALDFRCGLSVGTVRVFKSAMYGIPVNEAANCVDLARDVSGRCLIATEAAIKDLQPIDMACIDIAPLPTVNPSIDHRRPPTLAALNHVVIRRKGGS